MSLRILKRDNCERGTHHALLALDIENNSETGAFICAGLYGKIDVRGGHRHDKRQEDIIEYFSNLPDLHEYLLSLKKGCCKLVFYNLSYDIVYLRDILAKPKLDKTGAIRDSLLMVGTRVITAELKNGIKCLDLFNHTCEGSLEDWGKYCKFEELYGVKKVDLSDLHLRVMTDAELTYHLGAFIEDFYYNECGIPLQLTVGSSALKIFLTKYFVDYWRRDNDELSNFERMAYYGGRTEIFKRGTQHTYSYDINSTYLSIMRDNLLPDVGTVRYRNYGNDSVKDLGIGLDKVLSIIDCIVRAPDNISIGVLPVRVNGKLTFPLGQFRGVWCNVELIAAMDAGYDIQQVFKYVFYTKSKKYFHDFALSIWDKRIKYRSLGNAGMDKMVKRVGNSLYGKFGERHQQSVNCKLSDVDFPIPEGAEIYTYLNEEWLRIGGDITPSEHEFPCIPAFITAYARVKLLQGMQANSESIIYTDTDSIKLTNPARGITIGVGLGEWKDEGYSDTIFYRCKFYGDKHKGVPKKAEIIEKTAEHIKYKYVKPVREGEAMRRNLIPNVWTDQYKTLTFEDDKRQWRGNESAPHSLFYNLENILLTNDEKSIKYNKGGKTKFKPTGSLQERENNREKMREVSAGKIRAPQGSNYLDTQEYKQGAKSFDAEQARAAEAEYREREDEITADEIAYYS